MITGWEVAQQKHQPETDGVRIKGYIGGVQKTRYYKPTGEEVWAVPSIRTWVKRDAQKRVIASGTRDANLDKGWTLEKPTILKIPCSGCNKWHDTQAEVKACIALKKKKDAEWEKKARKQIKPQDNGEMEELRDEIQGIKSDMSVIKEMLLKLGGR